jgi:hypothetical protein
MLPSLSLFYTLYPPLSALFPFVVAIFRSAPLLSLPFMPVYNPAVGFGRKEYAHECFLAFEVFSG